MDTKEKILRSAFKVFVNKGFFGARVDDIASDADVAKGTIYFYFKDKKNLLFEMIKNEFKKAIEEVSSCIKKKEQPVDKLRILCENLYAIMYENKRYFESALRLWPGKIGEEMMKKVIMPNVEKIIEIIEEVLMEIESKEKVSFIVSRKKIAITILGIIRNAALSDVFFKISFPFEEVWGIIKKVCNIYKKEEKV